MTSGSGLQVLLDRDKYTVQLEPDVGLIAGRRGAKGKVTPPVEGGAAVGDHLVEVLKVMIAGGLQYLLCGSRGAKCAHTSSEASRKRSVKRFIHETVESARRRSNPDDRTTLKFERHKNSFQMSSERRGG
ncbi:Hypothetical predicted protein [Xyrichtys novacula]|uniref:Uncharacterized protein n=1 Tax=Xyrichtys novacula TaxID=13765 RepID=A0AAV1GIZ6_XYRNO|nr:Hypothetical predicted protein [Xyrichtys novacula]